LGFQFDSLADFVSFGLLPSILVYYAAREAIGIRSLFVVIFIISFLYLVSGMLRLARYNVAPKEPVFYGLPITAGGLIIALYVITGLPSAGLLIVALLLAGLMISDFKYPKVRSTLTLTVVGGLLVLILILYAAGTGYTIVSLVLLLFLVVYVGSPLYGRYFR
jgi:CDP-diacylglycerol--serine O-phosphatidyltransferase